MSEERITRLEEAMAKLLESDGSVSLAYRPIGRM